MTERIDAVVIGAGVVGLATARALGRAGREVIVLVCLHSKSPGSKYCKQRAWDSSGKTGIIFAGFE